MLGARAGGRERPRASTRGAVRREAKAHGEGRGEEGRGGLSRPHCANGSFSGPPSLGPQDGDSGLDSGTEHFASVGEVGGGRGQPRGHVCAACPSSSTRRPAAHPLLAASGPPSAPPPAAPAGEPSPEGLPGGLPAHGVLCPLVSGESGPRAVRPWAGQSSDLACDHGQGSPAAQAAGRGRPWRPGEGPRPPRPRPRARPVPVWARTWSSTGGSPAPPERRPPGATPPEQRGGLCVSPGCWFPVFL